RRPGRAGLHLERAAGRARGRALADRVRGRRRAADPRARLAAQARRPAAVLLEECEMAARDRADRRRPARLLGALRLPQRRGLLEGRALRLLSWRGRAPGAPSAKYRILLYAA